MNTRIDPVTLENLAPWCDAVACEINNQLELGLTDAEFKKLKLILVRKAWNAFKKP